MPIEKPKVVVVMPAYNAQHTLEKTWREVVAHDVVDLVVVVDDASQDDTREAGARLDRVVVHVHPKNRGYGGNQKSCYELALEPRRRHRGDGASRLSVHAEADSGDGQHGVERAVLAACSGRAFSADRRSPAACRCGDTSPIDS